MILYTTMSIVYTMKVRDFMVLLVAEKNVMTVADLLAVYWFVVV